MRVMVKWAREGGVQERQAGMRDEWEQFGGWGGTTGDVGVSSVRERDKIG